MKKGEIMMQKVSEIIRKKINARNKLDFLATIDDDNTPHITVLNTLMLHGEDKLLWGQWCEGASKNNLKVRPQNGFMVLTPQMEIFRGSSVWKESKRTGQEYDMLNSLPDFHYNAYYNLTCIHFMDLIEMDCGAKIDLDIIDESRDKTIKALERITPSDARPAMNLNTRDLFGQTDSIKVLSFITEKGGLKLIPVFQCVPADQRNSVAFASDLFSEEISLIPEDSNVALFCISTTGIKYSVLLKGKYKQEIVEDIKLSIVNIDKVYNPMLPGIGYIYPVQPLKPVIEFKDAIDV